ncbi:hypothetical protein V7100_29435, partial [Priestia megaterium]|uniref:hypothetical protein n=2 Tax=Bacillaceae TaxID=186817 RepID=UPI002FFE2EC1
MGKYSCHIVDSVKEMKKINVREGDVVKTLGYYSINDDGAAEYIIKDTSITSDEASIILLDSGLQAHLVVKREMNLEVFGGKGDALATKPTDNSKAHNKAMNALEKVSGKLILTGGKSYGFANTSYFPYNVGFDGGWSRIIPLPGGNFNKNFMFFINANLDGSIIKPWGGDYIIETGYTVFENYYKIKDIQAWYSKGRTIFKPMTYIGFYKGILKEGENDKDYSDFLTITNQKFSNCEGRSALIDIKYNGDALAIHNCTVDGYPSNNYNLIYIYGCNSGEIQNCVNGNITINSCLGLTINTFHCEHGNIQCINSVVILRNIVHWWNSYYQPIPLTIRNDAIDSVTGTSIV